MAKARRSEEMQALGRLLGEPAGRRWVWGLLSECHVWHTSMATNALRLAFLEGERSQGLRLLGDIQEANPAMFLQMLKEMSGERSGPPSTRDYNPNDGPATSGDTDDDAAGSAS